MKNDEWETWMYFERVHGIKLYRKIRIWGETYYYAL